MDIILIIFIGGYCFNVGYKAYHDEKQNKVFCKRNLPLKDVAEYNHFCGKLIMGFAFAAILTLSLMMNLQGWLSILFCIVLILEGVILMKIYNKKEITFLRQN